MSVIGIDTGGEGQFSAVRGEMRAKITANIVTTIGIVVKYVDVNPPKKLH